MGAEVRQKRRGAAHDAEYVELDPPGPVAVGARGQRLVDDDADVVREEVDAALLRSGGSGEVGQGHRIRAVDRIRQPADPAGADLLGHRPGRIDLDVGDDDVGASIRQAERDSTSDTTPTADDDGLLSFEFHPGLPFVAPDCVLD